MRCAAIRNTGVIGALAVWTAGVPAAAGAGGGEVGVASNTVHFVVSEWPGREAHRDSFVVPMTDSAHIAYARRLISEGPRIGTPIVLARIAPGADGINRNHTVPGNPNPPPVWSWHVTDCLGFADLSAEIFDGWPTFIESDVPGWMANTGGMVGFWSYTVTAELPPVCRADFNSSGSVTVQDVLDFLGAYFATDPRADFDFSGLISVQDIFAFLNEYFAGC